MADKKLNEVPNVTDMAYVPVIMADGSIGQIAKADLASVVAGLIVPVSSSFGIANKRVLTSADDANNLTDGRYSYIDANVPVNAVGYNATLFQFTTEGRYDDKYQIVFDFNDDAVYLRMHKKGVGWRDWKNLISFI